MSHYRHVREYIALLKRRDGYLRIVYHRWKLASDNIQTHSKVSESPAVLYCSVMVYIYVCDGVLFLVTLFYDYSCQRYVIIANGHHIKLSTSVPMVKTSSNMWLYLITSLHV